MEIVGAILVGGTSSRFGSPKGAAQLGGKSLLDRAAAAHRSAFDRVVVVGGCDPSLTGTEWIDDLYSGSGPLGGLHAAAVHAKDLGAGAVCLTPCDAPFVTADLLAAVGRLAEGVDAVVPVNSTQKRLEPMFGCYSTSLIGLMEEAIAARRLSLHGLIAIVPLLRLVPDLLLTPSQVRGYEFLNVNTIGDLAAARALLASHGDER